jgi:hypothetical protein
MLPLCALIPVPLLIAGRRHLRRSLAGSRRVAAWTAIASVGIAVETLFWVRLVRLVGSSVDFRFLPDHPSWHALAFSAGFLSVGAAMAGVLLGAPRAGLGAVLGHSVLGQSVLGHSVLGQSVLGHSGQSQQCGYARRGDHHDGKRRLTGREDARD